MEHHVVYKQLEKERRNILVDFVTHTREIFYILYEEWNKKNTGCKKKNNNKQASNTSS